MKKCRNCHVTILDPTMVCPLCSSVLEHTAGQAEEDEGALEAGEWMYPDVKDVTRKLNFVVQLYTFLAILVEAALLIINYKTYRGVWWSFISGAAILYLYMTLRYSIQKNRGYRRTILVQIIGGALLTVAIDYIMGYIGWSVNFVLPAAVLLMDLAILVLMIVNMANWQSYILLQIMTVLLSIVLMIFWWRGLIWRPVVTIVAMAVSAVLFLGTLIFGDRRARQELKRRFHV